MTRQWAWYRCLCQQRLGSFLVWQCNPTKKYFSVALGDVAGELAFCNWRVAGVIAGADSPKKENVVFHGLALFVCVGRVGRAGRMIFWVVFGLRVVTREVVGLTIGLVVTVPKWSALQDVWAVWTCMGRTAL